MPLRLKSSAFFSLMLSDTELNQLVKSHDLTEREENTCLVQILTVLGKTLSSYIILLSSYFYLEFYNYTLY